MLAVGCRVVVVVDPWAAAWVRWLPTMARPTNIATTITPMMIPVLGRRRWFIESSAIRWARALRGVGAPSPDGPGRVRSTGRASSKTMGASGSGNSSVPRTGTGGTTRPVATGPPSVLAWRAIGRTVGGPIFSDRCSRVPSAWL